MIIHSTVLDTQAKVIAIYGGTTWTQITSKFLFGTGTIDMYNDSGTKTSTNVTAKSTGGSTSSTLTIDSIPSHSHVETCVHGYNEGYIGGGTFGTVYYGSNRVSTESKGGSKPHNNMPPYYGVYIWERTA